MKEQIEKTKVKCPKCKHEFLTKSKMINVTCSSCQLKFKREENTLDE